MNDNVLTELCSSIWKQEGIALIQSCLDAGLDINSYVHVGDTMLITAAEWGNLEVVEFLLRNGADANIEDCDGSKPCHIAARNGHKDIVKFFLGIGIDIDCPDKFGQTMLHYAGVAGHIDILDYLLAAGADLHCRAVDGRNALQVACYEEGLLDVVKYLIKKGCDPNVQDNCLDTPLHFAVSAWNYDSELITHLLTEGADFNVKNLIGETPFSLFLRHHLCLECIAMFLEKGAYFQAEDYNFIIDKPLLKEGILQDVELCTQSVLNKFNYYDLPKLYERPAVARRLPPIEKMKISSQCTRAQNMEECVNYEIKSKGYCNVPNVRPNMLYCICVRYLTQFNDN